MDSIYPESSLEIFFRLCLYIRWIVCRIVEGIAGYVKTIRKARQRIKRHKPKSVIRPIWDYRFGLKKTAVQDELRFSYFFMTASL